MLSRKLFFSIIVAVAQVIQVAKATTTLVVTNLTTTNFLSSGENYVGVSVAGSLDFNKDSIPDLLLGAYNYNWGNGIAYLVYGSTSLSSSLRLDSLGSGGVTFTTEESNEQLGYTVASAGDFNKDGFEDILLGAECASDPHAGFCSGKAYLIYGSSSFPSSLSVSSLGSRGISMIGEAPDNYAGGSAAGGGDLNKDGYDDILIGATGYSSDSGRVYIIYGGSSVSSAMNLTAANVIVTGESSSEAGSAVSFAGDVNNDGYLDILVGAPGYSSYAGRTYLIYGSASLSSSISLGSLGSGGVVLTGETSSQLGTSVAAAGDINQDGYPDFIVGARGYSSRAGRAYLVYGGASLPASLSMASLGSRGVIITGTSDSNFGYHCAGLGDMNKDGFDDFMIGAYGYHDDLGRVYLFYGGAVWPGSVDLGSTAAASSVDIAIIDGAMTGGALGTSFAKAGDIDRDGLLDVLVGAPYANNSFGEAYLIYGRSFATASSSAPTQHPTSTPTQRSSVEVVQVSVSLQLIGNKNSAPPESYNTAVVARAYSNLTGLSLPAIAVDYPPQVTSRGTTPSSYSYEFIAHLNYRLGDSFNNLTKLVAEVEKNISLAIDDHTAQTLLRFYAASGGYADYDQVETGAYSFSYLVLSGDGSSSSSEGLSKGAIAGIVIGGVLGVALLVWSFFLVVVRRKRKDEGKILPVAQTEE